MVDDIKFSIFVNGEEKNFLIIDKFTNCNKNFIIYTEEDNDELYAALYENVNNDIKIIPIENDHDYDLVDEYLRNL